MTLPGIFLLPDAVAKITAYLIQVPFCVRPEDGTLNFV
jgi:hypothetical protein